MKVNIFLALILATLLVIFSLKNPAEVQLDVFGWQFKQPLGIVLLHTFGIGVIVGLLLSIPPVVSRMKKIGRLQHDLKENATALEMLRSQLPAQDKVLTENEQTVSEPEPGKD